MKFKLFFLLAIFFGLFTFSSCKKCGHCVYQYYGDTYTDITYCKRMNATSKVLYDNARSSCQSDGGTWIDE